MKKKKIITPQQQLLNELANLSVDDSDNLCIALVAYLRFGINSELIRLITE